MVVCTGLLFLLNTAGGQECTGRSIKPRVLMGTEQPAESEQQLTVLKVELVEVHALHQVSQRLGLKRGQPGVTDSPVTQNRTDGNQTSRVKRIKMKKRIPPKLR